ncbi:hypothetical protein KY343_04135 [Candidatus Woesearchaeota archaeon]|nr:hypothetical protein [Candidatus Woesearchaeota archaeon]
MARVKRTEKKTWYPIVAPKIFHNQVVGEILLTSPNNAVGRIIPVNLASLVKDPRRQHITIKLVINNAAGEKLHTEMIGYEINPSFVKRMVRKGGDKIDYSFTAETADDKKLKLKVVFLTRRKIKLSVATALRKNSEEILKKDIGKTRFVELMQTIVIHKIQGSLKKQLSKIYPLKTFEIRNIHIEKSKKHGEAIEVKKEAAKKAPKREEKQKEEAPKEETVKKEKAVEKKPEVKKETAAKEENKE